MSIMTSYNLINGFHAANNKELLTDVLRCEWGFKGLVMTDWGTTDPAEQPFKYGCSDPALCVRAGNDLTMPGSQRDVDRVLEALSKKEITLAQLQACACRVLAAVLFGQVR